MMHPHASSGGVVASGAIADTYARYDPLFKCIQLPPASSDGGAVLECTIVEMDALPSPSPSSPRPGRFLLGEIVEIVVVAGEDEAPSPASSSRRRRGEASPDESLAREELLQKQREQQELHYRQSQDLLEKHQREKQQLERLHWEGRLSNEGKAELSADMEHTHEMELARLQRDHHEEQVALTNLIFESASSATAEGREDEDGAGDIAADAPKKARNASDMWNRAAVATVAAGAMNQTAADEEERSQPTNEVPPENKTAGLWNRAAVATVAAGAVGLSGKGDKGDNAPAVTPTVNNTTSRKTHEERKKAELRVVMRDRDLSKEERIEKMTEIREKYSHLEDPAAPGSSAEVEPSASREELRRREISAVMTDRTLSREEKQARLAEIKARYAGGPSSRADGSEKKNVRWNRAAVASVAADTGSQSGRKPQEQQEEQRHASINGARLWNRAGVSAVSASAFKKSFVDMKQIQGKTTPMSEFIRKIKSNDPSLTTLLLDGRKTDDDEWGTLFDALEGNTHLTHLSLVDCGLTDETATPLVLALVENETLIDLNLSRNRDLTNGTGRPLVKVLKQSNPVLKYVKITGTKITTNVSEKLADILADRDDVLKMAKVQAERQKKITALLAFSASDAMSPSTRRLSQRLSERQLQADEEADDADNADNARSVKSGSTKTRDKGKKAKRKKKKKRGAESIDGGSQESSRGSRNPSRSGPPPNQSSSGGSGTAGAASAAAKFQRAVTASSAARGTAKKPLRRSDASIGSSHSGSGGRPAPPPSGGGVAAAAAAAKFQRAAAASAAARSMNKPRRRSAESIDGSMTSHGSRNSNRPSPSASGSLTGGSAAKFQRAARGNVAARNMAMLGGDIAGGTGKSADEVRQGRRLRGECETCGQKCFKVTMFKTVPLEVPGKVKEGRCLQCT